MKTHCRPHKTLFSILILLTIYLTSCTPKLDTSTQEELQISVSKMKNKLPRQESEWLSASLKLCTDDNLCDINDYNGLTAQDIIERGRIIKLNKLKSQADALITPYKNEFSKGIDKYHSADDKLKEIGSPFDDLKAVDKIFESIEIKNPRLYKVHDYFIRYNALSLSIKNNWTKSIKSVSVNCRLISPGRSIPWVDSVFSFEIDGGLEPGETRKMSFRPNMYSDLGKAETPKDAKLILRITGIDTPDETISIDPIFKRIDELFKTLIIEYESIAETLHAITFHSALLIAIDEFKNKCDTSANIPKSDPQRIFSDNTDDNYISNLIHFEKELKTVYNNHLFSIKYYFKNSDEESAMMEIMQMTESKIIIDYWNLSKKTAAEILSQFGY